MDKQNPTAEDYGMEVLLENADSQTVEDVRQLVADRKAEWIFDGSVDGVVGLVLPGTIKALVVVYIFDRDFETTDLFYDNLS